MQIEKLLLIIAIDIIHKLGTTIYILIAPKFLSDLNVTQCCNKMYLFHNPWKTRLLLFSSKMETLTHDVIYPNQGFINS